MLYMRQGFRMIGAAGKVAGAVGFNVVDKAFGLPFDLIPIGLYDPKNYEYVPPDRGIL